MTLPERWAGFRTGRWKSCLNPCPSTPPAGVCWHLLGGGSHRQMYVLDPSGRKLRDVRPRSDVHGLRARLDDE